MEPLREGVGAIQKLSLSRVSGAPHRPLLLTLAHKPCAVDSKPMRCLALRSPHAHASLMAWGVGDDPTSVNIPIMRRGQSHFETL